VIELLVVAAAAALAAPSPVSPAPRHGLRDGFMFNFSPVSPLGGVFMWKLVLLVSLA